MAVRLYHLKHDNGDRDTGSPLLKHGRTFAPTPTPDQMRRLKAQGWKESPADLPGYVHPPSAMEIPFDADETDMDVEQYADEPSVAEVAPPAIPKDIRTIPAAEAIVIIGTISTKATLGKLQKRESGAKRPRKSVLAAIDARLEQVG